MSFFRRNKPSDEEVKEKLLKKSREFDEKKRKKFLEDQQKSPSHQEFLKQQTEDKNAGLHSEIKAADPVVDDSGVFTGHAKAKSKGIRERISDLKTSRETKEYKEFLKEKSKKAEKEVKAKETEKKTFGRELSPKEKEEFSAFKQAKADKFKARRAKVASAFRTARSYSAKVGARGPSFATGGGGLGFGIGNSINEFGKNEDVLNLKGPKKTGFEGLQGGKDVLNINSGIAQQRNNFELNFGRMLGGKSPKKGKKKGSGLGLSIFD